jgi:uncharacterized protein (DUF1810 family)
MTWGGFDLERFVSAQDAGGTYERALQELQGGFSGALEISSCLLASCAAGQSAEVPSW